MDTCPFPRGPRSNSFDRCAHAELLKVLTADTNLDSIAKNGRPGKGKNQDGKIEGTADLVIMRKTLLGVTTYDEHFAENGYFAFSW